MGRKRVGRAKTWIKMRSQNSKLGGGNSNIFYFHPYFWKIPMLTHIIQLGGSTTIVYLGSGFKYFLVSPLLADMIQFD